MKNILKNMPDMRLNPRMRESVTSVLEEDIANKKLLDIGCGYGWFEFQLLSRGVKEIVGIEISERDIETAKKNIKDRRAIFTVGGALDLPFEDETFDIVVAWEVIEHIPKKTEDKMFSEIARVLKPGGSFFLSTPFASKSAKFLDPAWWLIGHRHYSERQLEDFGKRVSLQSTQMRRKGGTWSLIASLNMYISKWIFRRDPLFGNFIEKRESSEYSSSDEGTATIFVTYQKQNEKP